jgi:hypothetical protein
MNPPPSKRRIIERRKHPRFLTSSGALLSFRHRIDPIRSEEHTEGEGTLIELSRGGCRLLSDIPLEVGEPYHLILQVSKKSRPIVVETAVVRWAQESTYGLNFDSIQSPHDSTLRELLLDMRRPAP